MFHGSSHTKDNDVIHNCALFFHRVSHESLASVHSSTTEDIDVVVRAALQSFEGKKTALPGTMFNDFDGEFEAVLEE